MFWSYEAYFFIFSPSNARIFSIALNELGFTTSATPLMHARAHSAQYNNRILHHGGHGGGGVKPSGLALVAPRLGSIPIQPISGSYFVMSSHFFTSVGKPAGKHGRDSDKDALSVNGNTYMY